MKKSKTKQRSVCAIVADINENIKKANALFQETLRGIRELTAVTATKEGEPPEKAAPAKKKADDAIAKKEDCPVEDENIRPSVKRRTPASVRLTPREVTLNIGSYPVKELAENDARDLLSNPRIFWYRPIQFPDPRRYGVQPHVERAHPVKRTDPKFNRSPWTVSVTIVVTGDQKKSESWGVGVYNKNRGDQE